MDVLELIYQVIDEFNLDLDPSEKIQKTEDAVIYGEESPLDSMALINLISIIEQKIEDCCGKYIAIADENAMSKERSPFRTVQTLKIYIEGLLHE
jgi:acyl carrier protein